MFSVGLPLDCISKIPLIVVSLAVNAGDRPPDPSTAKLIDDELMDTYCEPPELYRASASASILAHLADALPRFLELLESGSMSWFTATGLDRFDRNTLAVPAV